MSLTPGPLSPHLPPARLADGGYQATLRTTITALLAKLQPGALALNGEGISPSPGRWSGTEGDVPPGWPNVHSTTCCHLDQPDPAHTCEGSGCAPDDLSGTAFYAPSSTDFTLQQGDSEPSYSKSRGRSLLYKPSSPFHFAISTTDPSPNCPPQRGSTNLAPPCVLLRS